LIIPALKLTAKDYRSCFLRHARFRQEPVRSPSIAAATAAAILLVGFSHNLKERRKSSVTRSTGD